MSRYYPKFHKGGCPDLYVVVDSRFGEIVSDAKEYHLANDEAGARNAGTFESQASEDMVVAALLAGPFC